MKIAIGCDPNAQEAKEELIRFIKEKNYGEVTDFGSTDPIYANTAIKVAEANSTQVLECDRGNLDCACTGMPNRAIVKGVRAAFSYRTYILRSGPASATMPM